jgi:nicotinate-nucleotide adenylyltransferase
MPVAFPGMSVGLLGGSFDPAHEGHAHLTREALKRLGLDRVWWLVSPGNPLKPNPPAPLAKNASPARGQVMDDPRVVITDIEARIGTRYTAETLRRLQGLYPGVRFVWLMGADNLAQLHRWQKWDWIMCNVPIAVFARPGTRLAARGSRAAEEYARYRVRAEDAQLLSAMRPHRPGSFWTCRSMIFPRPRFRARGEWRGGRWKR